VNNLAEFLNLITWSALQLVREILRESARSGKSVEELLAEAENQTSINASIVASLKAKLEAMQGND
jgi:urease gamma subunit